MTPLQPLRWKMPLLVQITFVLHAAMLALVVIHPAAWPWALALIAANHAVLTLAGLWPRSTWLGANWTKLPAAAASRNQIALTIDDGPHPDVTPKVLDLLDSFGVKATFFCIGAHAARYPELCRDIVLRGHAVENHTQHHRHHFSIQGMTALSREIRAAQETLTRITGRAPLFFRAPAGLRNPFLDPVLAKLGLRLAAWTRRGYDTRTPDADKVVRRLMKDMKAGAILLLHDGNCARTASGAPVILEVLPVLLEAAHHAGLHFVTLPAALHAAHS